MMSGARSHWVSLESGAIGAEQRSKQAQKGFG
jgi:hypothetical protein